MAWQKYLFFGLKIYLNNMKNFVIKKCLLIIDLNPSHKDISILDYMKHNQINYVFIPPGIILYLQPLELGWIKYLNKS